MALKRRAVAVFNRFIWRGVTAVFSAVGLEVHLKSRGFREQVKRAQMACQFGSLIDVGANQGDFTAEALGDGFRGEIVAIEPIPELCVRLRRRFASMERVRVLECAVGDSATSVQFHETLLEATSSLLQPAELLQDNEPGTAVNKTYEVTLRTLDDITSSLPKPFFLKLDVQGAEVIALRGGLRTLRNTAYISIEASLVHLYEGSLEFVALLNLLKEHGFNVRDISRGHWLKRTRQLSQVELLLERAH